LSIWGIISPVALDLTPGYNIQVQSPDESVEFINLPAVRVHPKAIPILKRNTYEPTALLPGHVSIAAIFQQVQHPLHLVKFL
jgi:hypothetical protein